MDPMEMVTENKAILGFNLIWMWDQTELMDSMLQDMFEKANSWDAPHVGGTFPFKDVKLALQKLQSGQTMGKIVLTTNI